MADGRGTYPSHSGYGGYNQGGSAYQQSYQTSSYGGYPQHQHVNQGGYYGGTPTPSQQQQHQALRDQQRGRDPRQQQQQLTRLQQYLGQVLSQGGSNALPYAEQVKYVVRQHVLDSVSEFPSLACSVTRFTHNDGSDVNILKLEGTAPMYFQGRKYNLPLTVWLVEGYPRAPPLVYLTPTSEMIIKSNHKFVDASGCVNSPYLEQWSFPSSNLRDLTTTLCIHFGQDPPLYAKPSNWRPAVHAAQAVTSQRPPQQSNNSSYPGSAGAGGAFHGYNPMVSPPPPQQQQQQQQHSGAGMNSSAGGRVDGNRMNQSSSNDPPLKLFKEHAVETLARRIMKTFQAIERHTTQSVEDRLCEQLLLEERASKLTYVAEALAKERDMIDDCIHKYESKTLELEGWLEKHREIDKDINDDLDGVFIPSDRLSEQAIEALAKDMAIEDAMYSLEQSLLNDALDPDVYMKQIRSLSRKQFYHRKLCMKISDLQKAQEQQLQQRPRANTSISQQHDLDDSWEILQDMNISK